MQRRTLIATASALMGGAGLGLTTAPRAAEGTMTDTLRLGTSPPGGGFTPFGDAFAATVNALAPGLRVEPVFTKGSTENIPLLEAGRLQLGLAGGEPTYEALAGVGRPESTLKIVAPMYSSAGMFIVPGNSPVRQIADLRGKPVIFGATGSGLVVLARYVLDGLGLDMARDFRPIFLERDDQASGLLADGTAAALWGGGIAWPAFAQLSQSPTGARFVVPDEAESAAILAKHGFLSRLTVAAGTYAGQTESIRSIGSWSVVLARADLQEESAYAIARAVHRGEAQMARLVASGRETLAANTWVAAPRQDYIHPGALRYLREAGVVSPARATQG